MARQPTPGRASYKQKLPQAVLRGDHFWLKGKPEPRTVPNVVYRWSTLAQLVEQARILDGDDGLAGEIADQLDLLLAR
jgi:hypothetical protein